MAIKRNSDNAATETDAEIPQPRTEVAVPKLSDEALKGLGASGDAFTDALALLNETYGDSFIELASEALGDGFAMLDNKMTLIGEGFVLIDWDFHMGDHSEYVFARLVTVSGKKLILTDGSQGIWKQLSLFSANTGKKGGLVVKAGLRQSTYDRPDGEGKATTYYLDLSA